MIARSISRRIASDFAFGYRDAFEVNGEVLQTLSNDDTITQVETPMPGQSTSAFMPIVYPMLGQKRRRARRR